MEKDIGRIKKNETTDVVVRIDDFGGKVGLTIREYVTSDRYTGFTKAGTRISAESFAEFKKLINSIDEKDLAKEEKKEAEEKETEKEQKTLEDKEEKPKRGRKKKAETSESKRTGLANEEEEAIEETKEEEI